MGAAYLKQFKLDCQTREFIFIVSLTIMRARGTSALLQTLAKRYWRLKISLAESGIVAFQGAPKPGGR